MFCFSRLVVPHRTFSQPQDTLFAGALAEKVLQDQNYGTICDSALASIDLWTMARADMMHYIEKAAQRHRLKKNGLDDVIEYCHTPDLTALIPVLKENYLISSMDL